MLTFATQKITGATIGVPPELLAKIDRAKRRLQYLQRLAEADVAAGRVSEFKMEEFFPHKKNAHRKN